MPHRLRRTFIITGMSGAGKSQALKSFEDLGFYCADNLPVALLPEFASYVRKKSELGDVALGIDIREGKSLAGLPHTISGLKKAGLEFRIIFFDASDAAILHRFSETRHRHPLGRNLPQAIKTERRLLLGLKAAARDVIDTSAMTLSELKETLSRLLEVKQSREMQLSVVSFGYKYGLPPDADIVMDVRFLSNPNYVPRLKNKTGLDKPVADFIEKDPRFPDFFGKFSDLAGSLVPLYIKEGKSYLTIAIGCTGGRHRSVFTASKLAGALRQKGLSVYEFHRDMRKQ